MTSVDGPMMTQRKKGQLLRRILCWRFHREARTHYHQGRFARDDAMAAASWDGAIPTGSVRIHRSEDNTPQMRTDAVIKQAVESETCRMLIQGFRRIRSGVIQRI
jgi:hypothetical protein